MAIVPTHNHPIPREVKTIPIPEGALFALESFLNQLDKDVTDVGDVDIAPRSLSLFNLYCFSRLDCDSRKFGDLNAALLDCTSSLAINDGWEYKCRFWTGSIYEEVVDNALCGVLLDYVSNLVSPVDVAEDLVICLPESSVDDIGD